MKIKVQQTINILAEEKHGAYTLEVYNYADTWLLEDEPAPDNWHELVYSVKKNGHITRHYPPSIAKIGASMVEHMNKATPTQTPMFPTGQDLPLFSGTPVKAQESQYRPTPTATQPRLFSCPVCLGTKQHNGKPCPSCK